MNEPEPAPAASRDARAALIDAITQALEEKRDAVNAEICSYPTPIPACDAHFNWLLEVRATVFDELRKLGALRAASAEPAVLEGYVSACSCLDAAQKQRIRERTDHNLAATS